MYKLKGGDGAIICSSCLIIIKAPAPEIWRQLLNWDEVHYCNKCDPYKKFIKEVEEFINETI
jgi:hypothetical protein